MLQKSQSLWESTNVQNLKTERNPLFSLVNAIFGPFFELAYTIAVYNFDDPLGPLNFRTYLARAAKKLESRRLKFFDEDHATEHSGFEPCRLRGSDSLGHYEQRFLEDETPPVPFSNAGH
jgi:hypothetical protein